MEKLDTQKVTQSILLVLCVLFGITLVRTAWLTDDIFITFRTIDNFIHGYGLTWNRIERVQTFTHPLWLFVLTPFYFITHDPYYTTLFLNVVISLFTVYLIIFRIFGCTAKSVFALSAILSSKAFIEYSTSGMENSLSHLLICYFFWFTYGKNDQKINVSYIVLITSLLLLTRMDLLLLILPRLLPILYQSVKNKKFITILLYSSPFWIWKLFSILYYGFLFPNTYYAKTFSGLPIHELMITGFLYHLLLVFFDPFTILVIVVGILSSIRNKNQRFLYAVGISIYILYTILIGGDWMMGRFSSAPFLLALFLLIENFPVVRFYPFTASAVAVAIGLIAPNPILYDQIPLQQDSKNQTTMTIANGILDARAYYYNNYFGLFGKNRPSNFKRNHKSNELNDYKIPLQVEIQSTIGRYGFYVKETSEKYILDPLSLSDAFLSKLPMKPGPWKTGHYARPIPAGYIETIQTGNNRIQDEDLARYYNDIKLLIRGPVFELERFYIILKTISGFNPPPISRIEEWKDRRFDQKS